VRIETAGVGYYFFDGQTDHFYDYNETIWLGKPLRVFERQVQKETLDQLLDNKELDETAIEIAKESVFVLEVQARNKIMYQEKQRIQMNELEEASLLLQMLNKYFFTDIYIFYHVVKIPFIRKNFVEIKHQREQYIHIPGDQIRKKKKTNQKIMLMFNVEMESYSEEFKKWNRKLFVLGRAEKLLIHLQTAQSLIGEIRFSEALRTADEIWEKIKETGQENETKKQCRNILTEGYQGEDNWQDASIFNQENLRSHANDIKTIILALRDAMHRRRIDEIKDRMTTAEQILNNKVKKEEGSEVFQFYRRELIEMINLTNHMKGCPIQVDENTEEHWISSFLLPPRRDQIVQPDFSVKPAEDVEMSLQKSADQDFKLMDQAKD
jgi:hypothetical protein